MAWTDPTDRASEYMVLAADILVVTIIFVFCTTRRRVSCQVARRPYRTRQLMSRCVLDLKTWTRIQCTRRVAQPTRVLRSDCGLWGFSAGGVFGSLAYATYQREMAFLVNGTAIFGRKKDDYVASQSIWCATRQARLCAANDYVDFVARWWAGLGNMPLTSGYFVAKWLGAGTA